MRRPSPLRLLLATLLPAAAGLLTGCDGLGAGDAASSTVRTATVERRDIAETIEITGQVTPVIASDIKSEISGRILRIHVKAGDAVTRGQLLVELDPVRLEADLRASERAVQGDRLSVEKAERDYARLQELVSTNSATEQQLFDARIDMEQARNQLQISSARLDTAMENLALTRITAPHDGIVIVRDTQEGQVISGATSVSNGTTLMRVADLRQLYTETFVNELDLRRVQVGGAATITFDAVPGLTVQGRIAEVAPAAILRENVRVFPAKIAFELDDPRVRPGISASVTLPVARVEQVPAVIISAVFNDGADRVVFVRDGESYRRRVVTTGLNDLGFVEIKSGAEPGDVISLTRPPAELLATE